MTSDRRSLIGWGDRKRRRLVIYLVAFEVGTSTGSEAFLTTETLQFRAHTERITLHSHLLTPCTHYLNIRSVLLWERERNKENIRIYLKHSQMLDSLHHTLMLTESQNLFSFCFYATTKLSISICEIHIGLLLWKTKPKH